MNRRTLIVGLALLAPLGCGDSGPVNPQAAQAESKRRNAAREDFNAQKAEQSGAMTPESKGKPNP